MLIAPPALAAPAAYSTVIEDLPLMPGMVEKTADAVVFDKPGGRIVETVAESRASETEIRGFYAETLPSLGWEALSPSAYGRDDEALTLDIAQKNGLVTIHFNLTPRK